MTAIRRFVPKLFALVRSGRADRDLKREIASHLDLLEQELQRQGMPADRARQEARRRFGGVDSAVESHRDERSVVWLDHLARDVRYATRTLARTPGFTAVAVLTLAIGIGANTAIFSLVDAVVFRPLPYPQADHLVSLWETHRTRGRSSVAPANLAEYSRASQSFVGVGGYSLITRTLTGVGVPEQVTGEAVTANMFTVRGVQPALGRAFVPTEDQPGEDRVVILTDRFWRARLGADPGILGRTLTLDGSPHEVVGVMPPSACACTADVRPSVEVAFLKPAAYSKALLDNHGSHVVEVVGRLKPGVPLAQAQAELDVIMGRLASQYPDQLSEFNVVVASLQADVVRDVRSSLAILLGAVGLVLLVACVNVANLLFVRALNQQREIALRRALGATRARVIAEATIRSLILSILGGIAGLGLGVLARDLLVSFAPANTPRLQAVTLNGMVLVVTAALALGTGLLAGILPAWPLSRESTATALRTNSGSITRSVLRWRAALMVVEVAAAIVLATGAGLLIRSFVAVSHMDLGFRTESVLTFRVPLPATRYPDARRRLAFFDDLAGRIERQPGVDAAAFANRFPLLGGWGGNVSVQTPSGAIDAADIGLQAVSPAYFPVLGIPLVRGRSFSADDREGAMPVAIVNMAFVRAVASGRDPIGWQLTRGNPRIPLVTIVGIVDDIRRGGKTESLDPQAYFPAAQVGSYDGDGGTRLLDVAVKVVGSPSTLVPVMRREVAAIDPEQAIANVKTLDEVLSTSLAERQFQLGLMASFAILAIGLALIGVYGVVSYATLQRAHEIGIRLALGATRRDVVHLLVGRGIAWTFLGVTLGLIGALALTQVMKSLLFSIEPTDPLTLVLAPAGVFLAAVLACYIPARRAAGLNPLSVLRTD
jgi:putative ABC transport system permease protein